MSFTKFSISFTILLIVIATLYFTNQRVRTTIEVTYFDLIYDNPYVESKSEIDAILARFKSIPLKKLPADYLEITELLAPKFRKMVKHQPFYILRKKDTYRKICGNIRIKDLVARDSIYQRTFLYSDTPIYWGIDQRILYKILELQDTLTANGYNRDGFGINHGHRHPTFNQQVGGASKSRHIAGEAVDMIITDINNDGGFTQQDKAIVLELCEQKIIGNTGGIGRYPNTRTVHMDVRGYRARWDSF